MRQLRHLQWVLLRWPRASAALGFLVAITLCGLNRASADRLPPSPVDELRQVLRADREGVRTSEAGRAFRKAALEKSIARIRSAGDLSQALLLPDWQDASFSSPEIGRIDDEIRRKLAQNFTAEIRRIL